MKHLFVFTRALSLFPWSLGAITLSPKEALDVVGSRRSLEAHRFVPGWVRLAWIVFYGFPWRFCRMA